MTRERPDKSVVPDLHRIVGGDGPICLLLHGVTRRAADWEPLFPMLKEWGTVIALDQRGHGESPRADRYLVMDYLADAERFVRDEVDQPLVVVGHSLGAMVAAALAAALPDRVRAVVLEDPPFQTMGNRILGTAWQAQFRGMREVVRRGGDAEEMTSGLAEIRLPSDDGGFRRLGDLRDESSLAWSASCLSHIDPEVLTPVIEGRWLDGYDLTHVLAGIRCPTLLLQADPSTGGTLTDADLDLALDSIATCRHVRFPGRGHNLHLDSPGEVWRAMQPFLNSISESSES
jgi:pimeloyl-ACP methyl ester carboxylesterase